MTTITSRDRSAEPLARLTLTEEQLETIVSLMDKAILVSQLETKFPVPNEEIADELLGQLAETYSVMTGIRLDLECYPEGRSFPAKPDEFEIIPAKQLVWDNESANELVEKIQENFWLYTSILDVAIDRLVQAVQHETKVQLTKTITLEGVAQFKNDTPHHLDLLNQTIVYYSVVSLEEYDRLFTESEGKPHPLLSRVEV